MDNEAMTEDHGQRTLVGADPLDYVLRHAPGDYDCFHQGRYIGSRPTLARAVAAVEEQQVRVARHPLPPDVTSMTLSDCQEQLTALLAQVQALAEQLASQPGRRAHLTLTHIQLTAALRSLESAERTLALAQRQDEMPIDVAA